MSKLEHATVSETAESGTTGEARGQQSAGTSPTGSTTREADVEDRPAALSRDVVFDVLKNRRRRLVLEFLRDRRSATLPDVAEHVAAVENDKDVEHLSPSERKRVYVGLYQCHVPMLADAGVVDYHEARKVVTLRDASSCLYPYLDMDHSEPGTGGSDDGGLLDWIPSVRSLLDRV